MLAGVALGTIAPAQAGGLVAPNIVSHFGKPPFAGKDRDQRVKTEARPGARTR